MNADNDKLFRFSQRAYRRLLAVYPRKHRAEYGDAMAQLFRDQSRDAWRGAQRRGLLLLWLRILPDLLKTSFLEHLHNLKGKKLMATMIPSAPRSRTVAFNAFIIVFITVFAVVLFTSAIVTFIMPETYASTARIKVESPHENHDVTTGIPNVEPPHTISPSALQTEVEIMQSEIILDRVIDQLSLNERWAKKYGSDTKFRTSESRAVLKRMVEIHPARNTRLLDIKAYDEDKLEASQIANSIVENYVEYRRRDEAQLLKQAIHDVEHERTMTGVQTNLDDESRIAAIIDEVNKRVSISPVRVTIIEHAEVGPRPVRPNKPFNIFLGAVIGVGLGIVAGVLAVLLVNYLQKRSGTMPPPVPTIRSTY